MDFLKIRLMTPYEDNIKTLLLNVRKSDRCYLIFLKILMNFQFKPITHSPFYAIT